MRLALVLLLFTGVAHAQNYPPEGYRQSTPRYAPPPPPPGYVVPPRYRTEGLRERGQRNHLIGAILIGTGVATLVAGAVMTGVATDCHYTGPFRDDYQCVSNNSGLFGVGVAGTVVGAGVLIGGIVTYSIGTSQLRRARWGWSLAPTVSPSLNGATFKLEF